jgi:hypothetical protein
MKERTRELERIAKREMKRKRRAVPDVRIEAVPMKREYNVSPADIPL